MPDGMEQLKQEVVVDLLHAWIDVYDTAEAMYRAFPEEIRRWIDEHGHRVESLVPVVAMMQPDARVLCLSLVQDGLAALEAPLSHPVDTVEGAVEDVTARAKSGGEGMGGVDDRIAALEDQAGRLEELAERIEERVESIARRAARIEGLIAQLLEDDDEQAPRASSPAAPADRRDARPERTDPREDRADPLAG